VQQTSAATIRLHLSNTAKSTVSPHHTLPSQLHTCKQTVPAHCHYPQSPADSHSSHPINNNTP
jgi:hypothetical protein